MEKYLTIKEWNDLVKQKKKLKTYKLKINKKRFITGSVLIFACVLTIGTNWLIPLIVPYMLNMPVDYDKYLIKLRQLRLRFR